MIQILAFITPKFLQKIDKYLLLFYPRIWITKIHYVTYYSSIMNVFSGLFVYIYFDIYNLTYFWIFAILVLIIEIVSTYYWLYLQTHYCIEKEYGHTKSYSAYIEIIMYIICLSLIVSTSFTTVSIIITKFQNSTDKNQIFSDFQILYSNDINIDIINKYTKKNISSEKEAIIEKSTSYKNCKMLKYIYESNNDEWMVIYTIFFIFINLSLILFNYKYFINPTDFKLFLLHLCLIVVVNIVTIAFFFSIVKVFQFEDDLSGMVLPFLYIYIGINNLFPIYHIIKIQKLNSYSRFKAMNLASYPLIFSLSLLFVMITSFNPKETYDTVIIFGLISTLSYIPILGFIKKEFLRLMDLPK